MAAFTIVLHGVRAAVRDLSQIAFHSPFRAGSYILNMGWRWFVPVTFAIAAACTPGAQSVPSSAGQVGSALTIQVSLLNYGSMPSAYGMVAGYNPSLAVVAHGTIVQFHNQDGFSHTASSVAGASFPNASPISSSAQKNSGSDIAQPGWSTGVLTAGSYSGTFTTSAVGQYLYGCYYHYTSGMRAVIIVQ